MAHRRNASDVDLIQNVRNVPEAEQQTFTNKRRAHIEEQCETLRRDLRENPNLRRSLIGRHINDVIVGGIDRAGMAGAYGLLRMRGYHSMHWDTPAGRLHALSAAGSGALPPLVICSGLGANSTDYIALLYRLHGHFRRVTVVELPGHGYSSAAAVFNELDVVLSYQKVLDHLTEQEPAFLVGHSLGGRMALDYVTGRGRAVAPPPPSGLPFSYGTASAGTVGGTSVGGSAAPQTGPLAGAGAASTTTSGTLGGGAAPPNAAGTQPHAAAGVSAAAPPSPGGVAGAGAGSAAAASTTVRAAGVGAPALTPTVWQTEIPALMRRRVRAVALVAAMGAPFSEADVEKLRELYTCEHFRQAALIQKGAMGTTITDPIMAGATFKRMRKPAVQALIRSELMSSCVPVEELRAVAVPTLLMWGGNDRLVPPEHLQHFARALPDAAVIKLLPRMSHNNFAMGHGPAVRQLLRFAERVMLASDPAAASAAHIPPPAAVEASAVRADTRDHVATYHAGALADVPDDVAAVVAAAAPPRLHMHRPGFLSHHHHGSSGYVSPVSDGAGAVSGTAVAVGAAGAGGANPIVTAANTTATVVNNPALPAAGAATAPAAGIPSVHHALASAPNGGLPAPAAVPPIEEVPPPSPPHAVAPARPVAAGAAAGAGHAEGSHHAAVGSAASEGSMLSASSLPVQTAQ